MRLRPGGVVLLAFGGFLGCAVGTSSTGDAGLADAGSAKDAGKDTSAPKDSGSQGNDSGSQTFDSGSQVDSGGGCGTCLGSASTCCGTTCVDTTSDPNNCGSCGHGCTGLSCCSSSCVDTTSDMSNCGSCGNACGSGMTCVNSQCTGGTSTCTISMGTCAHSPCTTGGALAVGCDSSAEDLTLLVCVLDGLSSCCSTTWDSSCVSDAAFWEANSCIGSGC
ncbi:MAG TPA: hypothetical protein VLM85_11015 [Polyangiaceae bacterium]|nr:hypothetical protein [Polyangiaceae bacterium]